jgi:hypothetical protein
LMVNEHKSEEEEKKDKRKGESLLLLFCFFWSNSRSAWIHIPRNGLKFPWLGS